MAKPLTPVRIAKVSRTSFSNSAEEVEVDMELALGQGFLLHTVEIVPGELNLAVSTAQKEETAYMSVHAETSTLEVAQDAAVDGLVLNSEILAQAVVQAKAQEEAATRGGSSAAFIWLSEKRWNFNELLEKPLLLATDLTCRFITSAAALVVQRTTINLFYQYVELSEKELADQFLLGR